MTQETIVLHHKKRAREKLPLRREVMRRIGDEVHLDTREASGGETPHIVRYVLMISLLLAILGMSAIWITGAAYHSPAQGDPVTAEEHALGGG